jgi:lipooligosaccharide transport system permease protein
MAVRVAARVLEREARVYSRLWRGNVFSSFVTPVLYLGAMGLGLGGIVDSRNHSVGGVSYLAFVTPGLLAAGAMQAASAESLWPVLSGFKWMRHYHAMSAAVPAPGDIYDGVVGWVACRMLITTSTFLAVAAALGGVSSGWAVLAVPAAVLGAMSVAAPLAAFAAAQQSDATFAPIFRLVIFPLFLFSGTFFPVTLLPGWGQGLVVLSPLWHAVELCRAATTGHGHGWVDVGHLAALLLCIAAGTLLGRRAFARRLTP